MKSRGFIKVQETRRLMRLFCATGFARLCGHAVGSLEIQHAIVLGHSNPWIGQTFYALC
jgi:hypothetical protein